MANVFGDSGIYIGSVSLLNVNKQGYYESESELSIQTLNPTPDSGSLILYTLGGCKNGSNSITDS